MQLHLKDHLIHRVCKHIRDSIRYLYSNPRTTYSQLMIAAHKAESENEEAHDKVRARPAVTTDTIEGTREVGHHIAKLIIALTRAGQGNSLTSTPKRAMEGDRWTGALLAAQIPIMAKLVWDRLPQSAAPLSDMAQG